MGPGKFLARDTGDGRQLRAGRDAEVYRAVHQLAQQLQAQSEVRLGSRDHHRWIGTKRIGVNGSDKQ